VEPVVNGLMQGYLRQAQEDEVQERFARALQNYRLALTLQRDPTQRKETRSHVQELARKLEARKEELTRAYREARERGEVADAASTWDKFEELVRLQDDLAPELQDERRELDRDLRAAIRNGLQQGRSTLAADLEKPEATFDEPAAAFHEVLLLDPGNELAEGYLSFIESIRSVRPPPRGWPSEEERLYAIARAATPESYEAMRDYIRSYVPPLEGDAFHARDLETGLDRKAEDLIEEGRRSYRAEEPSRALEQWNEALLIDPGNERALAYRDRAEQLLESLEQLREEEDAETR
jgi:tetratricopeptide (TPR) repeat protein